MDTKIKYGFFITIVIVLVFVIGLISYSHGCKSTELSYLNGFWETNNEFNKESGLYTFTMFIKKGSYGKYSSYILMIEDDDDQTILINEPVEFTLTNKWGKSESCDCREMTIKFDKLETKLLPSVLNVRYYPSTCKVVLYDKTKVYSAFFKNPVLSELERIKSEEFCKPIKSGDCIKTKKHAKPDAELDVA